MIDIITHFIIPSEWQKVKDESECFDRFVKTTQFETAGIVLDRESGIYYNNSNDIF